jgi:uncharacterized protein YdeI (YjbR/CyaY-like superfamily)
MTLKRQKHRMPAYVRQALEKHRLVDAYNARPAYQQNDYLGWILRAKRDDTKEKRLKQMLGELAKGGVYMKMPHNASRK